MTETENRWTKTTPVPPPVKRVFTIFSPLDYADMERLIKEYVLQLLQELEEVIITVERGGEEN